MLRIKSLITHELGLIFSVPEMSSFPMQNAEYINQLYIINLEFNVNNQEKNVFHLKNFLIKHFLIRCIFFVINRTKK